MAFNSASTTRYIVLPIIWYDMQRYRLQKSGYIGLSDLIVPTLMQYHEPEIITHAIIVIFYEVVLFQFINYNNITSCIPEVGKL